MPKIKLYRGLKANLPVLDESTPAFTTDTEEFFIGSKDGNIKFSSRDDLITELSGVNGNAELLAARGSYPTLAPRLDNVDLSLTNMATSKGVETNDLPDYRGVSIYGRTSTTAFTGQRATDMLNIAQSVNMNMILITPVNQMPSTTANTFNGQLQPNADITSLATSAKSMGFMVGIKPYVEVVDGSWRANIAPTDVPTWFANFKSWIVSMATLAQTLNADVFCLGAEMRSMSGWNNRSYWVDLISSVRSVYTGKLTYGANGNGSQDTDEIYTFCFIDLIDYAGIDLYPPLTNQNDPTVTQLINSWYNNFQGINWVNTLEKWSNSHGKPIIINEIGCPRVQGANQAPSTWFTGAIDNQEQANFITAMFDVLRKRCSWIKGLWWWGLDYDVNDSYTFEYEPSLTQMKNGFTSNFKG